MATYAIGDVQGCYDELRALLDRVDFSPASDTLWFVGDLVNRGPKSLEVLRFVRDLGARAVAVLGNHDLHLVCVYEQLARARRDDTLEQVLDASDARELVDWLRLRPVLHSDADYTLVHAGLLPNWSLATARLLAAEVEGALREPGYRDFLAHLYGSQPTGWDDTLTSWDRLRVIVNAMTRMRYCTSSGVMEFHAKGARAPQDFVPWFEARGVREEPPIICGHWSALGLLIEPNLVALDSGCVWGGSLSAIRLEDRVLFQVPGARHQRPGSE